MSEGRRIRAGAARRLLASAFILFHGYCVLTWVCPGPSAALTFLLSPRVPLPTGPGGRLERHALVPGYMHLTGQHQGWMLFAPNPLQHNRYVDAVVVLRDGRQVPVALPRLDRLGVWDAWLQKRWRRYQHGLVEHDVPGYREDFARYLARRVDPAGPPPVRVILRVHEAPIPRHDRPAPQGRASRLVKDPAAYATRVLLDYAVRPEDRP